MIILSEAVKRSFFGTEHYAKDLTEVFNKYGQDAKAVYLYLNDRMRDIMPGIMSCLKDAEAQEIVHTVLSLFAIQENEERLVGFEDVARFTGLDHEKVKEKLEFANEKISIYLKDLNESHKAIAETSTLYSSSSTASLEPRYKIEESGVFQVHDSGIQVKDPLIADYFVRSATRRMTGGQKHDHAAWLDVQSFKVGQ